MGKQINALTTTRGVAAIMVVIFHFGWIYFPFNRFTNFFQHGALAVGYFFILSGFVLYTAHREKSIVYADYIRKRIARIVPVYLFALAFFVCLSYHYSGFSFTPYNIKLIVVHALLLQAYIPDYAMNLNIPAWTLSVEMCFYLLFPFFLVILKRNTKFFIVMTIVLYLSSQIIHLHYFPLRHVLSSNIIDTVMFSPLIHINQFLIGMFGGYLFGKIGLPNRKYGWLALTMFVIIVFLMAFMPQSLSCHAGLIAPVFMLFILSLSVSNPRILNIRPLVFIGEISYGIYILQMPVFMWLDNLNIRYLHIDKQRFFYFFFCMLVLVASMSYYFFENPIRKKINSLNFGRKSNQADPPVR